MELIGKTLKEKRIEKGLTIEDVSDAIKIRRKYLEAIESGNYSEIPDKVYTKSFLKIYAEFLELDRVYVLKRYLDEISQEESVQIPSKTLGSANEGNYLYNKEKTGFRFLSFLSVVLVIVLIVWAAWALTHRHRSNNALLDMPPNTQESADFSQTVPEVSSNVDLPQSNDTETNSAGLPISLDEIEVPHQEEQHFFDSLQVELKTSANVWISHTTDNLKRESFTMPAHDTRIFEADQRIRFQIGNAGGLNISINRFSLGMIGKSGEVMDLEVILSPGQSIQVNVIKDGKIIETKTYTP